MKQSRNMKKILVTTDFSAHSKAGLRFAIQLSVQQKYELTFFHSYNLIKPTSWSDASFAAYEKKEVEKIQKKLNQFVESVYKSMGIVSKSKKCVIASSVFTDSNIREYAREMKFNFICISTRGAGKFKKHFGTNTSNLITFSEIPVIAVPDNYRRIKITNILYASDLSNLEKEIKQVVDFAKPLKARVELLHLNSPAKITADTKTIETAVKKFSTYDIKLQLENCSLVETFISNIETAVSSLKPSMLIMFTKKNKTFFQKLFLLSKTVKYSFNPKVPLMVFRRN